MTNMKPEIEKQIVDIFSKRSNDKTFPAEPSHIAIGDVETALVIVDNGDLGIDFVNKEGNKIGWLNSIGEYEPLQMLISKHSHPNVRRNAHRIIDGTSESPLKTGE